MVWSPVKYCFVKHYFGKYCFVKYYLVNYCLVIVSPAYGLAPSGRCFGKILSNIVWSKFQILVKVSFIGQSFKETLILVLSKFHLHVVWSPVEEESTTWPSPDCLASKGFFQTLHLEGIMTTIFDNNF